MNQSIYLMLTDTITGVFGISDDELSPQTTFEQLEFDSLALVELAVVVEQRHGIVVDDMSVKTTLEEITGLVELQIAASPAEAVPVL